VTRYVFGYGSLIWRPDFPFRNKQPAIAHDYARRLWQGSIDHRGMPGAPGRVVTLVPERGERCVGMLFEIAAADANGIITMLDRREQGGYVRHELEVTRIPELERVVALTYIALPNNPNYLGPAEAAQIAAQVGRSHGPSGSNREYLERLALALVELGAADPHIFEVRRLLGEGT
jgi:cation transport protein ChaC